MAIGKWIVGYLAAGSVFVALDLAWLSLTAPVIYRPAIGHLLAERFDSGAAIAFYILYFAGLLAFAVKPGFEAHALAVAGLWGAAFGLAAYATYDLTNMATLKDWPLTLTVVDMAWGAAASAVASAAGYLAMTVFARV